MIAGLAGAWFSLEATGSFNDGMTRGAGFIALAAMIFGKWTPIGAFGAALLFGFSDSLGIRLQMVGVGFPGAILADGALRRDAGGACWLHRARFAAESGRSALCEGVIQAPTCGPNKWEGLFRFVLTRPWRRRDYSSAGFRWAVLRILP